MTVALPPGRFERIMARRVEWGIAMQALTELIAGVIAMLAAAALAQFGVDLNQPSESRREVHRVKDCGDRTPAASVAVERPTRNC